MPLIDDEKRLQQYAQLAGFLYLFVMASSLCGGLLASSLTVPGNFVASAVSVARSESAYRAALAIMLTSSLATIPLAGAFYVLLRSHNRNLALFAFAFRIGEAVLGGVTWILGFMILQNYLDAATPTVPGMGPDLAKILSAGYRAGFYTLTIFFSVGSTLFFLLLLESGFIPRLLAIFGFIASILAAILGFMHLVFPTIAAVPGFGGWMPIFIAEIATGLWLLVSGIDLSSRNNAQ